MIYKFEETFENSYFVEIEADSFEEAKQKLEDENPEWESDYGGESYLSSSRCLQYEDEDAIDEGEYEELEWSRGN